MNNKERLFLSKIANSKLRSMEQGMMKTWGRGFSGGAAGGSGAIAPPNSSIDSSKLRNNSHLPGVSNKSEAPAYFGPAGTGFRDHANTRDTSDGIPRLTGNEIKSLQNMRRPAPQAPAPQAPAPTAGSNQLAFNVNGPGQFTPSSPR